MGLSCVAIVVVASGAAPPMPCWRLRRSGFPFPFLLASLSASAPALAPPSPSCGELNCAIKSWRLGGMGCHQLLSCGEDEGVGVAVDGLRSGCDCDGGDEGRVVAVVVWVRSVRSVRRVGVVGFIVGVWWWW